MRAVQLKQEQEIEMEERYVPEDSLENDAEYLLLHQRVRHATQSFDFGALISGVTSTGATPSASTAERETPAFGSWGTPGDGGLSPAGRRRFSVPTVSAGLTMSNEVPWMSPASEGPLVFRSAPETVAATAATRVDAATRAVAAPAYSAPLLKRKKQKRMRLIGTIALMGCLILLVLMGINTMVGMVQGNLAAGTHATANSAAIASAANGGAQAKGGSTLENLLPFLPGVGLVLMLIGLDYAFQATAKAKKGSYAGLGMLMLVVFSAAGLVASMYVVDRLTVEHQKNLAGISKKHSPRSPSSRRRSTHGS